MLREAQSALVLTGAGVSVPSGIPDFRSPGTGIWEKVNPMEVAHIDAFRRQPDRFWQFYGERFASLVEKEPNPAHHAIAELERRGLIRGVVTQNVDRLHRRAGSSNVIEVHGSIEWSVCPECGGRVSLDRVIEVLAEHPGAPECTACIAPLKPDVVLFGELLPEAAIARATQLAAQAGVLLVVGSSLEVYPVAGLPLETLAAGGALALVNRGGTQFDSRASVTIDAGAGETLRALADALLERP
jgi:NAD-dependent deacetylase